MICNFMPSSRFQLSNIQSSCMQTGSRVFITGSNRGIGKQLVKLLNKRHPQMEIHISSRGDPTQLVKTWNHSILNHQLKCYQLDLTNQGNIQNVSHFLKNNKIEFDFLVANAAKGTDMGQNIPTVEVAESTLKTNVNCTIEFIKYFLPNLKDQGRIVIVSSDFGALSFHSDSFAKRLTNPSITEKQILSISQQYINAAKLQQMGEFNWSAYKTSKALLNCWARFILPKYLKQGQTAVCMHPGWCSTDMGGPDAYFPPSYGASLIQECFWLKQIQKDSFFNRKFCSYTQCE